MNEIYKLNIVEQDGSLKSMSDYEGKVLLIVNTATGCGFTPQYSGLQTLYETYKDQGFELLDFPCNQFKEQAPGTDQDINAVCSLNFGTTFSRFKKIDVNGDNQSELFSFLKSTKGGFLNPEIKWNFTKFLVNKNGEVVRRFPSTATPKKIEQYIKKLL